MRIWGRKRLMLFVRRHLGSLKRHLRERTVGKKTSGLEGLDGKERIGFGGIFYLAGCSRLVDAPHNLLVSILGAGPSSGPVWWRLRRPSLPRVSPGVGTTGRKAIEPAFLPPTARAVHFHGQRVYHQLKLWRKLMQRDDDPTA